MGRSVPLLAPSAIAASVLMPGQLEPFGSGRFAVFFADADWTPPAGVTRARFRCHGGGGDASLGSGGTASVAALISATGGLVATTTVGALGGQGFGGDFQADGGVGGAGSSTGDSPTPSGGGGAAGSEMGDGGDGGNASTLAPGGGGAVGGNPGGAAVANAPGNGASPVESAADGGRDVMGQRPASGANSQAQPINTTGIVHPFPMFAFNGYGLRGNLNNASISGPGGGGGGGPARNASNGGGGGGCSASSPTPGVSRYTPAANYDFQWAAALESLRGCGGSGGEATRKGGSGGGGYARGVFDVVPGTPLAITASDGALVIVEW